METMNNGRYVQEYSERGKVKEVIRYNTNKKYSKQELEVQREQFEKDAKAGKVLCLSDLMINHGM